MIDLSRLEAETLSRTSNEYRNTHAYIFGPMPLTARTESRNAPDDGYLAQIDTSKILRGYGNRQREQVLMLRLEALLQSRPSPDLGHIQHP